ncbi:hypothetical protein FF38_03197 [Lucilia cuprina]|uniref:Uncharacterized protein n=1 Tax=Lucilia cuprina TaxID=7375 RepID=A0A0L0BP71_LUCCU|nr:hypothetical protein FF38_03197 [Lucilia cuprina]
MLYQPVAENKHLTFNVECTTSCVKQSGGRVFNDVPFCFPLYVLLSFQNYAEEMNGKHFDFVLYRHQVKTEINNRKHRTKHNLKKNAMSKKTAYEFYENCENKEILMNHFISICLLNLQNYLSVHYWKVNNGFKPKDFSKKNYLCNQKHACSNEG